MRYIPSIAMGLVSLGFICIGSVALAGSVGGPIEHHSALGQGQGESFGLVLEASRRTTIVVTGDGSGDLDCRLQDSRGKLVAFDEDKTDACILTITPQYQSKYVLRVQNNGQAADEYMIAVN